VSIDPGGTGNLGGEAKDRRYGGAATKGRRAPTDTTGPTTLPGAPLSGS